jgi:hypothetical protein
MTDELSNYIESMRHKLRTETAVLHDKLYSVECQIDAEKDGLMRHIDAVSQRLAQAKADVIAHAETLSTALQPSVPRIEERFAPPRVQQNADQLFDALYRNGAQH